MRAAHARFIVALALAAAALVLAIHTHMETKHTRAMVQSHGNLIADLEATQVPICQAPASGVDRGTPCTWDNPLVILPSGCHHRGANVFCSPPPH